MNKYEVIYEGELRTSATHLQSGTRIFTDAPKDNHGMGEAFSPTDMICTSLASCILTILSISLKKSNINLKGTTASVKKTMGTNPRRIAKIEIDLNFFIEIDKKTQKIIERTAKKCPVHLSLSKDIDKTISFNYLK